MTRRIEMGPGLELHSEAPRARAAWDRDALLERVRVRIRSRHMSPRTEKTYLGWIRRYLAYHGRRNPASIGRAGIERFLAHLSDEIGLSADSRNQAASSIVFLYRELFGKDLGGRNGLVRAREPTVLPKYATPEEVDRVLGRLRGTPRLAAIIMYGSGTRVSETVAIRIKDLNLTNRELTVREGKGARDRTTVIADAAVPWIRRRMEAVAAQHERDLVEGGGWAPLPGALHRKDPRAGWELGWQYLFPSRTPRTDPRTGRLGRRHVHPTTIQRPLKEAARRSGIAKPLTCHVLRHCFATEMLRGGCDVRTLQRLMGHRDLKTTARYLHILDRPGLHVESPLDRLPSRRQLLLPPGEG